ncbi:YCF48-related protein [Candidatus Zixiibacteriota bacterium]
MRSKLVFAAVLTGIVLAPASNPLAQDFAHLHPHPTGCTLHDATYNEQYGELYAVGDVETVIGMSDGELDFSVDQVMQSSLPITKITKYVKGTAYALSHNRLIKTADHGRTWTNITPPQGLADWHHATTLAIHPDNPDKVWVGGETTMAGQGLWVSENGGATWVDVEATDPDETVLGIHVDENNPDWIVVRGESWDDRLWWYLSTDGGIHWERQLLFPLMPGGPAEIQSAFHTRITSPKQATTTNLAEDTTWFVLAVGRGGSVARSWDAGRTWDSANVGTIYDLTDVSLADTNHAITVSMVGEVFYTTDGGDTWLPGTIATVQWLNAVVHQSVDTAYAVGGYGVIFQTTDAGATWNELSEGPRNLLLAVHFPTPSIGYACGLNGTILKTDDAGATWTDHSLGTWIQLESVFFTSPDTGYIVCSSGLILKTGNGGTDWIILTSGTGLNLHDVHFPTTQTGYAVGDSGVFRTTDGGVSWDNIDPSMVYTLQSVFFLDADTGFAVGVNGTIRKTTDGGDNWVDVISGVAAAFEAVHFPSRQTGYIVGDGGVILKTDNGGQSWDDISTEDSTAYYYSVHFTSPTEGYVVGMGLTLPGQFGTILQTTNGGDDWTEKVEVSTTANILHAVHFPHADTGYIAGYGGTIVRAVTDMGSGILEESVVKVPERFRLWQNYPNPLNASTVIKYELPAPTTVSMTIYNILGQAVITMNEGDQPAGIHALTWNGISTGGIAQPSGVYFYRIRAGEAVETKKMVLLR